ncbi:substrate-binding domain-containing protein [Lentisphaerota bacterium WC36G]|nr:substrate-binding domain-containing protein [Lentisphaerae bacterium WC36]
MKIFQKYFLCAVGCVTLGLMSSCGDSNSETAKPDEKNQVKTWTIGMSQSNLGEPWRVQMNEDLQTNANKHKNLKIIFKNAQNDSLKQRSQMEEFINSKVDLIIISPKEAAPLTQVVAQAMKRNIPVIVLDRKILGKNYTCYISADNKLIGEAAGKWIKEHLPKGGKLIELKGLMTSTPGQDRHNGFVNGIKGHDFETIFEADMKWLEGNARKEMESALARFPKIDVVYSHNDPGAHGAYLAAKAVGREKEIMFVGIDGLPQEGQIYVKKGILSASFEYPNGSDVAIETALKILRGEKFDKNIILPSKYFTAKNIDKGGEYIK